MPLSRPDLSGASPEILEYIENLESEIERLSASHILKTPSRESAPTEPYEPPTTINVITLTASGLIKRTPRHFYPRQRRAGMGIFDIDTDEDNPPSMLTLADQEDTLLVLTSSSRAYTFSVASLIETPVRGRGAPLEDALPGISDEKVVFIGPLKPSGSLAMLSERGYVRVLRHNYIGNNRPGMQLFDTPRFGSLAAAGWINDNENEIFIATLHGLGIRFKAKMVHPGGSLGIRLERGDSPMAICGTNDEGVVFLLGADGKGTIRLMSGFRSNKAPGAGGKVAIKAEKLVSALSVTEDNDIFIISKLSKIIRFQTGEIPAKEGTVQGVICMSLRADECVGAAIN
jgi:DNA gyrase subunit A